MRRIVLTGGIGSGKSTVARRPQDHGAVVIDADELSREVVEPGTDGLAAIVAEFGRGVLRSDGALDRAALGRIVFRDDAALTRLNAIVHPLVRQRSAELERAALAEDPAAIVVHDVPLAVETGRAADFDEVIVVEALPIRRVERVAAERGLSKEDVWSRIAAQASDVERARVATRVIDNNGTHTELLDAVDELWESWT